MAKIADVQEVSLEKLRPYERNAKKHGPDQVEKLKESILEFGFLTPCLIDSDYNLIAGHGRVMAANGLGMRSVPCVFIEGLTDEQRRAYILADNRLGELGEWDFDLVFDELEELDELGFDIELTGFELPEELPEVVEDDFDEESVPEEPRCKLGDLWQLGDHRLICGDSTDASAIDKLMDGQKADLLLTDPPYGIDYGGMLKGKGDGKGGSDKNGWKSWDAPSWDESRLSASELGYIISLADEIIMWGGNYYSDVLPPKMCWLVWDKGQRDFSLADGELAWTSFDKALRIKTYSRANANREDKYHPTQKPIELLRWCIVDIAERNMGKVETIIDVFGGSGSTLIACEQLNRKCYMCELDPHYCDVIINRWETLTGREAVLIDG